jgi:hypothetical protein
MLILVRKITGKKITSMFNSRDPPTGHCTQECLQHVQVSVQQFERLITI